METSPATRGRVQVLRPYLAGVVVVAAVVVLVGASLWLTRGQPLPGPIAPDGPVAAYQAYVEARQARDVEAAWGLLSRDATAELPRPEFEAMVRQLSSYATDDAVRISVVDVTERDDSARLVVEIAHVSEPGLLDDGQWTEEYEVILAREQGTWRLTSPWDPWW